MAKIADITDISSLSKPEIEALIGYFVEFNGNIELVKGEFERVYAPTRISAVNLKRLQTKYAVEIKTERENFISDPTLQNMYHLAYRLRRYQRIHDSAMREIVRYSVKTGNSDGAYFEEVKLPDEDVALATLKAAASDVHTERRIQIEEGSGSSGAVPQGTGRVANLRPTAYGM